MRGPRYNYEYTGDELCEAIIQPAMELFATGAVSTYVFCADEPSRVPREKAAEQKRRLEPDRASRRFAATNPEEAATRDSKRRCPSKALTPSAQQRKEDERALERVYPADAVVVAGGICYRPQMADGTHMSETITETLHLPSLLRQRNARTSIWAYLATYLATNVSIACARVSLCGVNCVRARRTPWCSCPARSSSIIGRKDLCASRAIRAAHSA